MNENLDLTKILANVPKGTKLFCTEAGYVELSRVTTDDDFPIGVTSNACDLSFTKDGYAYTEENRDEFAEQCLFPAHDQRDWSKFKAPNKKVKVTLHPFDKVLVKCGDGKWIATLVTDFDNTDVEMPYLCLRYWYKYCIPYNKETAHLIGTTDDCPIDYEIEFSKEFKE